MRNRKLITLLAGTAAIAAAPLAWTQSTDTTVGTGTSTAGSTTSADGTMGTSGTSTTMGTTGTSTTGTSTTTDTGTTTGTSTATDNTDTTTGTSATSRDPDTSTGNTASGTMGGTSTTGTSGTTTGTTSMTPGHTSGATTGSASGASGNASLQGTDATFLQKAMEGGREEVQNAQVAMRSAQRAEVRNAASMMLEDHGRSNQKLEQLASSKGWNVPAVSDAAESDQSRLGSGAGFDDNYLEQEIRHHRETISLYRAQASSGSDPELRQFAKDSLPTLEHHLEMLQGSISAK